MCAAPFAIPRHHERRPFVGAITYRLTSLSKELCLGITANISDSGICINTMKPLAAGEQIVIRNRLPVPFTRATIIWVQKGPGEFYKAGLRFIE